MNKPPRGWPRISPSIYDEHPQAPIDWLCRAFGFEVRLKIDGEGGRVEHSELTFGDDGLVMVGTAGSVASDKANWQKNDVSPNATGQNAQGLAVFVDDVDAHFARAKAAGATIFHKLKTDDSGEEYWSTQAGPVTPGDEASVSVLVKVPPASAFRSFTEDLDQWWRSGMKPAPP